MLPNTPTLAGRARGKVGRPNDTVLLLQERINLLLLPNVIAGSQNLNARRPEFFGALDIDSHAARGVLGIGDYEIDFLFVNECRDEVPHGTPRGTSHHIPKKQHSHRFLLSYLA